MAAAERAHHDDRFGPFASDERAIGLATKARSVGTRRSPNAGLQLMPPGPTDCICRVGPGAPARRPRRRSRDA